MPFGREALQEALREVKTFQTICTPHSKKVLREAMA